MRLWIKENMENFEAIRTCGTLHDTSMQLEVLERRYPHAYSWLMKQMELRMTKPEKDAQPIMAWKRRDLMERIGVGRRDKVVHMGVEAEAGEYLLFDPEAFAAVMQYRYIPADEADAKRYHQVLATLGICEEELRNTTIQSTALSCIRKMVWDSWNRVFMVNENKTTVRALMWQIKKEQITKAVCVSRAS